MTRSKVILGVNYGGHDTSAALMVDGRLVAACEQERYCMVKHTRDFPREAVADCLRMGGISIADVDALAFGLDHHLYLREFYLRPALESDERLDFLVKDIERVKRYHGIEAVLRGETGFAGPIHYHSHHLCHLASSYYPSGFDDALLVSNDGLGEVWAGFIGIGRAGEIEVVNKDNRFPHSLGLVYSALTYFLGWQHHCDEGIIMGLAPFGDPHATIPGTARTYLSVFEELVRPTGKYSYEVDLDLVAYHIERDKWVSDKFTSLMGPRRQPGAPLTDHHRNIAAALQQRLEDVVLAQLRHAREEFGLHRLCLSGGVALNCSMNGKIERSGIFDEIFVQPASGDAGIAIGACYLSSRRLGSTTRPCKHHDFYLGASFDDAAIQAAFRDAKVPFERCEDISDATARRLQEGCIVGWFQGGSEFGPRALGNRSILAKPFPTEMRDHINARVKFREPFRPFAPAVLAERSDEYFDLRQPSPHMLIACQARANKAAEIGAVVHVDGSCRTQTVGRDNNPRFYALLRAFEGRTGCPVLLNTSFNVKGQPIVNTPRQAVECFRSTNIDVLVIGDYLAEKVATAANTNAGTPAGADA